MENNKKLLLLFLIPIIIIFFMLGGIYFYFSFGGDDRGSASKDRTTKVTPTPQTEVTSTPELTVTPTQTSGTKDVKVFFSKVPESNDSFFYAEYRVKKTDRADVATFSLEQSILGPSDTDKEKGVFTPIKLSGVSNCEGKDFTITIVGEKATVQFCRDLELAGVGDDARLTTVVKNSVMQFETVKTVVLLDKNSNCVGDMSGLNKCKV